jgi:hypothetical protein
MAMRHSLRAEASMLKDRRTENTLPKETWPTTDENEERQDAPAALRPLPSLTTELALTP